MYLTILAHDACYGVDNIGKEVFHVLNNNTVLIADLMSIKFYVFSRMLQLCLLYNLWFSAYIISKNFCMANVVKSSFIIVELILLQCS